MPGRIPEAEVAGLDSQQQEAISRRTFIAQVGGLLVGGGTVGALLTSCGGSAEPTTTCYLIGNITVKKESGQTTALVTESLCYDENANGTIILDSSTSLDGKSFTPTGDRRTVPSDRQQIGTGIEVQETFPLLNKCEVTFKVNEKTALLSDISSKCKVKLLYQRFQQPATIPTRSPIKRY